MQFLFLPLLFLFFFLSSPFGAFAQIVEKNNAPVEIEASEQLEWLRDKNMYRATGDVKITRGTDVITGDYAEALYDPEKGSSDLTTLTVTGNVVMTAPDRIIHAEKGVYDTATQNLVLTGGILTLEMPDLTVTAHDSMEYNALENRAIAVGKAEVNHEGQILKAARVTAWLQQGGNNALVRAVASGNVTILRKSADGTDIAQAQQADYTAATDTVELKRNVKITRGTNHMQGDHAVINLKTGHSTLQNKGGSGDTGRVRAIFSTGND